jgi:pyruvate,water dikinase
VVREIEVGRKEEIARLRVLAIGKRKVWTVHNLGETLRFPTPLTWDIVKHFMSGDGGFGRMYRDFGYRPSKAICERGFLELICGRIYADPDRLADLFWDSMPLSYDREAVLKDRSALNRAPTQFDPEKVSGRFLIKLPGVIAAMLRSARIIKRARRTARQVFEESVLPSYLEYVRAKRSQNLGALPTSAVIAEIHELRARVLDDFGKESLKPAFAGAMAFAALETRLTQLMGKEEGAQLVCALTAGLEGDTTFEQDALLYRVATGESMLDEFLTRFGHRATDEMELAEPRWREDQTYLRQIIQQIRSYGHHSPIAIHQDNVRRREEAEKQLPQTLKQRRGRAFQDEIEQNLREVRSLLPYREAAKDYLMMGYELIRLAILELAGRWNLGNDIFFLHLEEMEQFESDKSRLLDEIARRKIRWWSSQRLDTRSGGRAERRSGRFGHGDGDSATGL